MLRFSERLGPVLASDEGLDHFGVECHPALCDPGERVVELVEVQHPVLEQIAEAGGPDQVEAVPELDVLGEQQDAGLRMLLPDRSSGHRAVGVVVRRHPDVDHRQHRVMGSHRLEKRVGVADCGHDLVTAFFEETHEPLAEEH